MVVAVVFTVALVALATAAATATWPILRPPISGLAFSIGFLACELAGQLLALAVGIVAATAALGWPSGALGVLDAVLAAVVLGLDARLLVGGLLARRVVARALRSVTGVEGLGAESRDAWWRWWRTCLVAPLGHHGVRIVRDVAYVDDGDEAHLLDVYAPANGAVGAPVLVFVHGGAWVFGSKRGQGLPMLHELAARGWVCVTCNYRLSPAATWPDHVVDVKRALAWTRMHAHEYGGDPVRFFAVAGNSAGGHLAALSALAWNEAVWQPGFEEADTRVDACVSLYGVLETTGDAELAGRQGRAVTALLERAVMKASLADARAVYEAASPLHRLAADAPPFLVLHGTKDSLVPVTVARAFVEAFRRETGAPVCYVELPGAQHAFDLLCSPRARASTRGIAAFLDALVARKAASGALATPPPPAPR